MSCLSLLRGRSRNWEGVDSIRCPSNTRSTASLSPKSSTTCSKRLWLSLRLGLTLKSTHKTPCSFSNSPLTTYPPIIPADHKYIHKIYNSIKPSVTDRGNYLIEIKTYATTRESGLHRQDGIAINGFPFFDVFEKLSAYKLLCRVCSSQSSEKRFLGEVANFYRLCPDIYPLQYVVTITQFLF